MFKTLFLILLIYIAYRFIFGFVIPVTRATRTVRQQFKAAQDQMEAQMRARQDAGSGYQAAGDPIASGKPTEKVSKSDYIDFEEIK